MFVLVTDLLDNFGKLVFDRIKERGAGIDPKTGQQLPALGKNFTCAANIEYPSNRMAVITSGCGAMRSLSTKLALIASGLWCISGTSRSQTWRRRPAGTGSTRSPRCAPQKTQIN